jgi:ankyrin repeat protein
LLLLLLTKLYRVRGVTEPMLDPLIKAGADVNQLDHNGNRTLAVPHSLTPRSSRAGHSALHMACFMSNATVAAYLFNHGADPVRVS